MSITRAEGRSIDSLRDIFIRRHYTCHAEGSVLIEFGMTKVICNASLESGVPGFLKGKGKGWLTAEYGMLPRSTANRMRRQASDGKPNGRTMEIQRLIGRALRTMINLKELGENTLVLDCDVIQADGGTRTAAITGAAVAVVDAIGKTLKNKKLSTDPITGSVAAVSVGLVQGMAILDLDYQEDSSAETDMSVVINSEGKFIEIQGTAEKRPFSSTELEKMLSLAGRGIEQLLEYQRLALAESTCG